MKRFLLIALAAAILPLSLAQAQPLPPPPGAAPPQPEATVDVKLTNGELKATVDMINVCISANPAGCAEAGVIMRKKFEAAGSLTIAAPLSTPPVASPPAERTDRPIPSAPIGGSRGPSQPTSAPSANSPPK